MSQAIGGLVFTSGGKPVMPWSDLSDWRALLADLGLPAYGTHGLEKEPKADRLADSPGKSIGPPT